ncbi:hypothetical protein [Streptomyces sp. NPDC055094]
MEHFTEEFTEDFGEVFLMKANGPVGRFGKRRGYRCARDRANKRENGGLNSIPARGLPDEWEPTGGTPRGIGGSAEWTGADRTGLPRLVRSAYRIRVHRDTAMAAITNTDNGRSDHEQGSRARPCFLFTPPPITCVLAARNAIVAGPATPTAVTNGGFGAVVRPGDGRTTSGAGRGTGSNGAPAGRGARQARK